MTRTLLPIADEPDLCVTRVPIFQGLSHAEQVDVAGIARPRSVTKGELVHSPGEATSLLMVLHTGTVKVSRFDAEGHEQVLRVLAPGDFLGESSFLTGRDPGYTVTAMEDGSMCTFRHADLGRLVAAHPSIGQRMLVDVSRRLADTEGRLAAVISGDVSSRLADYLLSLHPRAGRDGLEVRLPLPKKDIASLLDTTPESLSRQLRRLRDSGTVTPRGARDLVIHDVDALMELSAAP